MRRLILSIICLATAVCTYAVKAWPFPVDVRQSDGTILTIVLHGDEDFSYYTTLDGVLLSKQDKDFFVADINAEGELTATGQLAHNAELRMAEEILLASNQNRSLFLQTGQAEATRRKMRREPINTTSTMFPHMGTPKAIVILAEFKDTTFTIENPKRSFNDYFNSPTRLVDYGRGETANLCSVAKYFEKVSFGQFVPQFDVYGPVTLPSALKTYGGTKSDGSDESSKMKLLFQDACALMNDSLDFSQYDANDDGYVDLVIIVYAGYSQSMSGNSNECIWPKSGTTEGGTYDGKKVSRYAVNAELNGYPGCWSKAPFERINGTGTMCHEFCHTLGLPDFYPTIASIKGDNQGMEYWSLMDSGNYNSNGYAPIALNAWEREAFGWMEIADLTEGVDLDIKSIDDGGTAYRIANDNDESGHEYFVIENIQKIGINQAHKANGLVVYHIDYDKTAFSLSSNSVNNQKGHPRMTVVPADGLLFAQYNVGKTIDGKVIKNADFYEQLAGDPFPGTAGVTELNDTTGAVNFQVYNGEKLNKALSGITESEDGVISLRFISDFTSGITHTPTSSALPSDDSIYTLDGRKVGNNPEVLPRGIYITRGKKIIR